jgi:hypothetical protein
VITRHTCYSVTCSTPGCDPWDDGTPHFPTPAQAIEHARSAGWTIVGTTARCESCSRQADCERTGHRWGSWDDRVSEGVPYRWRWCDHCGHGEPDQPLDDLAAQLAAARIVNAATDEETR